MFLEPLRSRPRGDGWGPDLGASTTPRERLSGASPSPPEPRSVLRSHQESLGLVYRYLYNSTKTQISGLGTITNRSAVNK